MRYFREIDLPDVDTIIAKSLAYIKTLDGVATGKYGTWNSFDPQGLLTACPELVTSFEYYGLRCTYAATFVTTGPTVTPRKLIPHIDNAKFSSARINLPLLNCKNTRTEFFSNAVSVLTDEGWRMVTNTDYVLEAYMELSKATVVRVHEPHRVVVPAGNPVPRVALTLDFDKDPVFLLED